MTDKFSVETRSRIMSKIRSKGTKLEMRGYKLLRQAGFFYRKHPKSIIGCPDAANKKRRIAIFFDGDFWHGYQYKNSLSKRLTDPFWIRKIERNMSRDIKVVETLENQGWTVMRFWEHEILKDAEGIIESLRKLVKRDNN